MKRERQFEAWTPETVEQVGALPDETVSQYAKRVVMGRGPNITPERAAELVELERLRAGFEDNGVVMSLEAAFKAKLDKPGVTQAMVEELWERAKYNDKLFWDLFTLAMPKREQREGLVRELRIREYVGIDPQKLDGPALLEAPEEPE